MLQSIVQVSSFLPVFAIRMDDRITKPRQRLGHVRPRPIGSETVRTKNESTYWSVRDCRRQNVGGIYTNPQLLVATGSCESGREFPDSVRSCPEPGLDPVYNHIRLYPLYRFIKLPAVRLESARLFSQLATWFGMLLKTTCVPTALPF